MNMKKMILILMASGALHAEESREATPVKVASLSALKNFMEAALPLTGGKSELVVTKTGGEIFYAEDEKGNRVPDFSLAGYQGGGVKIPDVAGALTLSPSGTDDTALIQEAVDKIAQREPDAKGFRGALFLKAGKYVVSDTIQIPASGIVLRGSGAGFAGTWIFHKRVVKKPSPTKYVQMLDTQAGRIPTVQALGKGIETRLVSKIKDGYLPVGRKKMVLENTGKISKGQKVVVYARHTTKWLETLELSGFFTSNDTVLRWERTAAEVDPEKKTITLDVALTSPIDLNGGFAEGEVHAILNDNRLSQIGVEDILFLSDYDRNVKDKDGYYNDENHPNTAVRLVEIRDAWVRRVVGFAYSYSLVQVLNSAFVTVEDSAMLDGVSLDTPGHHEGSRKYYFNGSGWNTLFQRCYGRSARHTYIMNGPTSGNVYLDCVSTGGHLPNEPHQKWQNGSIFDNVFSDTQIKLDGTAGHAHGQRAAFCMIWNSAITNIRSVEPDLVVNTPPGNLGRNWAIGNIAVGGKGTAFAMGGNYGAMGEFESTGKFVEPRSLYLAQLAERLGSEAVGQVTTESQRKSRGEIWRLRLEEFHELPSYPDPALAPWGLDKWTASLK